MKKFRIFLLLSILIISNSFSSTSFAQTITPPPSEGLLDRLASIASLLLTGNNTVHLNNPKKNFDISEVPVFTLLVPDKELSGEEITASITRAKDSEIIPTSIKKIKEGEFEITLSDTTKIIGQYSLSVTAKESPIYTRHILLDFSWGDVTALDPPSAKDEGKAFMKSFLEKRPEYKNLPVVKANRNSVHFKKPDGTIEANFSAGPINYQDTDGSWKPIDTDLKQVPSVILGSEATPESKNDPGQARMTSEETVYSGSGTPAKITSDGEVIVDKQTHSQKTTGFGWFDPKTSTFSSVQELPQGKAEGNKFIRETKDYKHILTLLDTGLKEELILYKMPDVILGTPSLSRETPESKNDPGQARMTGGNLWLVLETEVKGVDLEDGEVDEEFKVGDNTFPLPTTKDAQGNEAPTKRFAKKINNKQYIYTGISYQTLKDAVYPLTIDPDFTESTNDGYVQGFNATYSTARSTAASFANTTAPLYIGQALSGTYSVYRSYLKFDTSTIGGSSTVTQVNLKLTVTQVIYLGTHFDVDIMKQDWSAQDPITSGNKDTIYDNTLSGTLDDNIFRNTSGVLINTQYTSGNLSTAWVSTTGNTYYGLISSRDVAGTTPTGNEFIWFASQDHTTSAYRPILTVTYTASSSDSLKIKGLKLKGVKLK